MFIEHIVRQNSWWTSRVFGQGQNQRRQALHRAVQEAQVVCCTAITAGGGLLKETQFPLATRKSTESKRLEIVLKDV